MANFIMQQFSSLKAMTTARHKRAQPLIDEGEGGVQLLLELGTIRTHSCPRFPKTTFPSGTKTSYTPRETPSPALSVFSFGQKFWHKKNVHNKNNIIDIEVKDKYVDSFNNNLNIENGQNEDFEVKKSTTSPSSLPLMPNLRTTSGLDVDLVDVNMVDVNMVDGDEVLQEYRDYVVKLVNKLLEDDEEVRSVMPLEIRNNQYMNVLRTGVIPW